MTEFIIVIPVLILLIFGAIQIGFIYSAKTTLNYATFQAARVASMDHATYSAMRRGLIRGLAPLYTNSSELSDIADDIEAGIDSDDAGRRDARSEVDNYVRFVRISPTDAQMSITGFAVENDDGILEIPNDNLMFRPEWQVDGATIQDANLLKIRVQYCYKLMVPLVNKVIGSLSELNNTRAINSIAVDDPREYETLNDPRFSDANRYYNDEAASTAIASYEDLCQDRAGDSSGFILSSEAIVRMQSPAYAEDVNEDFEDVMCNGIRMACP